MNNILIVPTALRPGANSTRVARALEGLLADAGASVTVFDSSSIPLFGSVARDDSPEILAYRDAVSGADAVVWAVPTYHNEMPGSAKNALDHIDPGSLGGTLHAVVGVAAGSSFPGAVKFAACLRFLGGRLPLNDVFIGDIRNKWPQGETTLPEALAAQLDAFAKQLNEAVETAKA